jgi:hypothetical protein
MYNNVYLYDIEFRNAPCFNFDLKYIQSYLVMRSNEDADPNYVRSGHEIGFIVCTSIDLSPENSGKRPMYVNLRT